MKIIQTLENDIELSNETHRHESKTLRLMTTRIWIFSTNLGIIDIGIYLYINFSLHLSPNGNIFYIFVFIER